MSQGEHYDVDPDFPAQSEGEQMPMHTPNLDVEDDVSVSDFQLLKQVGRQQIQQQVLPCKFWLRLATCELQALLNERIAPEVLDHKTDVLDRVKSALDEQASPVDHVQLLKH